MRAIISTSDKSGLLPLCTFLKAQSTEIVSTGNTARFLIANGIEVTTIEALTQFPEILDGRVKTLHPRVFAGILAKRSAPHHMQTLNSLEIAPFDLVVVNLYPFESEATIENVDIGGPSLLRAAAKNHDSITVLSDPSQYERFMALCAKGGLDLDARRQFAAEAFAKTAQYDLAIATFFAQKELRYGENPHQKAQVLPLPKEDLGLASAVPLQGKELSYNNYLDAHAAILSLRSLCKDNSDATHGAVIIKHTTPCGASQGTNASEVLERAFASDPLSAFGGIIALSFEVDEKTALALKPHFLELIIAPSFNDEARAILAAKKDLRLLALGDLLEAKWPQKNIRSIFGGLLIQDFDTPQAPFTEAELCTPKAPTAKERSDLAMAHRLSLPCLSNAITLVKDGQLIGVGAGQTSRVDAVRIAIQKARAHGHTLTGAVMASDGFFPFPDSLEIAKEAGISCVVQPGGSKKDPEVIAAAKALDLAMLFTHERHFRH